MLICVFMLLQCSFTSICDWKFEFTNFAKYRIDIFLNFLSSKNAFYTSRHWMMFYIQACWVNMTFETHLLMKFERLMGNAGCIGVWTHSVNCELSNVLICFFLLHVFVIYIFFRMEEIRLLRYTAYPEITGHYWTLSAITVLKVI